MRGSVLARSRFAQSHRRRIAVFSLLTLAGLFWGRESRAEKPPDQIARMVKALDSGDQEALRKAAESFTSAPPSTIDTLSQLLESPDRRLRFCSVRALRELHAEAHRTVPRGLNMFLRDPEEEIRLEALNTLSLTGWPAAKTFIPAILKGFDERPPSEKVAILTTLRYFGHHSAHRIPWLLELARDQKLPEELRKTAISTTAYIIYELPWEHPFARQGVLAIYDLLRDEKMQEAASVSLTMLSVRHPVDLGPLVAFLRSSSDRDSLIFGLRAVQNRAPVAATAIPAIVSLGKDPKRPADAAGKLNVRVEAIETLGAIPTTTEESLTFLLSCLDDPEPQVEHAAVEALGKCGAAAAQAVPRLIFRARRSGDGNVRTQRLALEALSRISPKDQRVLDLLVKNTRNSSAVLRTIALAAIGEQQIVGEAVRKAAVDCLNDPWPGARGAAARVCILNEVNDARVIAAIREIGMGDPSDAWLRKDAIETAGLAARRNKQFVAVLREMLDKGPAENRHHVLRELDKLPGELDDATKAALLRCLDHPEEWHQVSAASILLKRGVMDDRAIERLAYWALRGIHSASALEGLAAAKALPASVVTRLKIFENAPDWQTREHFSKVASRAAK